MASWRLQQSGGDVKSSRTIALWYDQSFAIIGKLLFILTSRLRIFCRVVVQDLSAIIRFVLIAITQIIDLII